MGRPLAGVEAEPCLKMSGTAPGLAARRANALGLRARMRPQRVALATAVLAGCTASAVLTGAAPLALRGGACAAAPAANLSMDQAVKMVESRFHARVVKAETQRDNGRTVYLLRLLNDAGRVWTVHVDAVSGSVQ